ncbi:MAG: GtrA family protein [Pirellulales bacterium]
MSNDRAIELRRFVVYGAVGAVNTAICYLFFAALVHWCQWHHHLALAADYAFGVGLGYAMHRASTFADRRHLRGALGKYTITLALTFVANFVLLDALVRWTPLGPLVAQAIAMTAATLVSYSVQTRWVFRSHGEASPSPAHVAGASQRRVIETTRRAA